VAVDAEGGLINRLKQRYGFIPIPSHQELGKKDNLEETERFSSFLAQELSLLGFNLNFAPVVDLNLNPENPVIGGLGRSFSEDPGKVFNHARAFISGQHKYGILTSIKHFPGHGSSKEDSHKGLVDVTDTYSSKELEPFQELIKSSMADLVMTAHIINRNIDPDYPATLSSRYIKEILRKEMGFQGVVVSDDLQMGAITENYGFEEALVRSINAGCNLLILSNNSIYDESIPYNAVEMIFKAVKDGRIEKSSITDSWSLIKKLKNKII
jgi:beta-N-acetylhexosaminidase